MKQLTTILLILALSVMMFANDGAVNDKMLKDIRASFQEDAYTKAAQNAISNNSIQDLTLNRSKVQHIDKNFSYRIDVPSITDQESTGRCWLFTSLNVLRPKIVQKYNLKDFEFSENYLFFWDQFEKANLFLENIIATKDKDIFKDEISVDKILKDLKETRENLPGNIEKAHQMAKRVSGQCLILGVDSLIAKSNFNLAMVYYFKGYQIGRAHV